MEGSMEMSPAEIEAGQRILAASGPVVALGQCTAAEQAAEVRAILAHAVIEVRRHDRDALWRSNSFGDYWRLVTEPHPTPWPSIWDDRVGDWLPL
jgi:hypothetical protein